MTYDPYCPHGHWQSLGCRRCASAPVDLWVGVIFGVWMVGALAVGVWAVYA